MNSQQHRRFRKPRVPRSARRARLSRITWPRYASSSETLPAPPTSIQHTCFHIFPRISSSPQPVLFFWHVRDRSAFPSGSYVS